MSVDVMASNAQMFSICFNSRQIKGLSFSQINVSVELNRLGGWALSGRSQRAGVPRMQQTTSLTPSQPVAGECTYNQIQTL